jgi:hypothetical protein
MILTILSYKLIEFTKEVILGTLFEEPLSVIDHWNWGNKNYRMGW